MLPLEPLSQDDTAVLLESLAGPFDPVASHELRRVTGGNPLFLEEMVRMLAEDGRLVERDGRIAADLGSFRVPGTIQAVLAARLDRLDEDERDVLQRASVTGQVRFWAAVAELTPPDRAGTVAGHLQALVRKGLVRPEQQTLAGEDSFRFTHILVRDAAYDSTPKRQRGELHERFADWLEPRTRSRPELDEILGHHLEQARAYRLELGPGGAKEEALATRAFESLTRAGRRALGRGDLHAAQGLLERAAGLLSEDDPRRLELAPELGLVLTEVGQLARAEEILTEAICGRATERARSSLSAPRSSGRRSTSERSARRVGARSRARRRGAAEARADGGLGSARAPGYWPWLVPRRPRPRILVGAVRHR